MRGGRNSVLFVFDFVFHFFIHFLNLVLNALSGNSAVEGYGSCEN